MDIRIFGGAGKVLGKSGTTGSNPFTDTKATPYQTKEISQVLSDTDDVPSQIINIDEQPDNEPVYNGLPGGKTPDKNRFPKNKPVSQGGSAKFINKKPKKEVIDFDWSDSEDDEILANLSQSFDKTCDKKSTSEILNLSDDSDKEEGVCLDTDSCSLNKLEDTCSGSVLLDSGATEAHVSKTGNSSKVETSNLPSGSVRKVGEAEDVRAMLRKVWGQKNFNTTNTVKKIGSRVKTSGSTKIGNPVKRLSNETSSERDVMKKRKVADSSDLFPSESTSSEMSIDLTESDLGACSHGEQGKGKKAKPITSPIEKLFKRMKEKQEGNVGKHSTSNAKTLIDSFKSTSDSTVQNNNLANPGTVSGDSDNRGDNSPCPVCAKHVPTATINDHLDLCLTMQAISAE